MTIETRKHSKNKVYVPLVLIYSSRSCKSYQKYLFATSRRQSPELQQQSDVLYAHLTA